MDAEFERCRAGYPSVSAALAEFTRVDWIVLLAREVADAKTAVRMGIAAAQLSTNASEVMWLVSPNPSRLESAAAWAGDDAFTPSGRRARAIVLAALPSVGIALFIVSSVFTDPWTDTRLVAFFGATLAIEVVLATLLRRTLDAVVTRRASRLDERTALETVLNEIRRGNVARPQLVPLALASTRRRLQRFVSARVPRLR